jgi:ubiquitin thioesterase protein OTUB1
MRCVAEIDLSHVHQAVLDEAVPNRPLIAPLVPMEVLRKEYESGNQVFIQQINWLIQEGYLGIRRTRGDGKRIFSGEA